MKKVICILLAFVSAGFILNVHGQDGFIKLIAPGSGDYGGLLKGGSKVQGHENEIEVLSYSNGISSCPGTVQGGGQGACKPSISDLNIMTTLSTAMIQARYHVLNGTHLTSLDLALTKTGADGQGYTFYRIHMEDVTITSIQDSWSSGGGIPTYSLSFSSSRVAWAYYEQKPDGSTELKSKAGWNVSANSNWVYNF